MDKKTMFRKNLRTVVSLILVGLYVLGLISMMTFSFKTGLVLWVISTLGGIGLLYWIHTVEKREQALSKPDAAPDSEQDGPEA